MLRDPFKRWVNKLKYYTSHLHFRFSVIFLSKLLCPDLQNALATATLEKNLGPLMSKWSDDSCLQENQELQTTCTLSMTCQIDVVNKQLFPLLIHNINQLSVFKNILMAYLQTCRCQGKMYSHAKNNLLSPYSVCRLNC